MQDRFGPLTDTRPLAESELLAQQRRALHGLLGVLASVVAEVDRQPRRGRHDPARHSTLYAASEPDRTSRVLMISGPRGTGKTSTLLTLVRHWQAANDDRLPHSSLQTSDRVALRESAAQVFGSADTRTLSRLFLLPVIDLHPLPPRVSVYAWLIDAFRPLVEHLDDGTLPHGDHPSASLQQAFDDLQLTCVRGWDRPPSHGASEDHLLDTISQVQHWRALESSWERFVDMLLDVAERKRLISERGILVLPLDDVDLHVHHARDVVLALRRLRHDRLVFLLTGDHDNLANTIAYHYEGDVRTATGGDPKQAGFVSPAAHLAQELLGKVLPQDALYRLGLVPLVDLLAGGDSSVPKLGEELRGALAGVPWTSWSDQHLTPVGENVADVLSLALSQLPELARSTLLSVRSLNQLVRVLRRDTQEEDRLERLLVALVRISSGSSFTVVVGANATERVVHTGDTLVELRSKGPSAQFPQASDVYTHNGELRWASLIRGHPELAWYRDDETISPAQVTPRLGLDAAIRLLRAPENLPDAHIGGQIDLEAVPWFLGVDGVVGGNLRVPTPWPAVQTTSPTQRLRLHQVAAELWSSVGTPTIDTLWWPWICACLRTLRGFGALRNNDQRLAVLDSPVTPGPPPPAGWTALSVLAEAHRDGTPEGMNVYGSMGHFEALASPECGLRSETAQRLLIALNESAFGRASRTDALWRSVTYLSRWRHYGGALARRPPDLPPGASWGAEELAARIDGRVPWHPYVVRSTAGNLGYWLDQQVRRSFRQAPSLPAPGAEAEPPPQDPELRVKIRDIFARAKLQRHLTLTDGSHTYTLADLFSSYGIESAPGATAVHLLLRRVYTGTFDPSEGPIPYATVDLSKAFYKVIIDAERQDEVRAGEMLAALSGWWRSYCPTSKAPQVTADDLGRPRISADHDLRLPEPLAASVVLTGRLQQADVRWNVPVYSLPDRALPPDPDTPTRADYLWTMVLQTVVRDQSPVASSPSQLSVTVGTTTLPGPPLGAALDHDLLAHAVRRLLEDADQHAATYGGPSHMVHRWRVLSFLATCRALMEGRRAEVAATTYSYRAAHPQLVAFPPNQREVLDDLIAFFASVRTSAQAPAEWKSWASRTLDEAPDLLDDTAQSWWIDAWEFAADTLDPIENLEADLLRFFREADRRQLRRLEGIGATIATKLIELRSTTEITNLADVTVVPKVTPNIINDALAHPERWRHLLRRP
jgi:hypothetical protein